jgi:hypothetical protein
MGWLAFVNWSSVNRRFCALMWIVALALAVVVLVHVGHAPPPHRPSISGH